MGCLLSLKYIRLLSHSEKLNPKDKYVKVEIDDAYIGL